MARFDYLRDRREGLRAIIAGECRAIPAGALAAAAGPGLSSMRLVLEAAGLSSSGVRGALRARALGVAYHALIVRHSWTTILKTCPGPWRLWIAVLGIWNVSPARW